MKPAIDVVKSLHLPDDTLLDLIDYVNDQVLPRLDRSASEPWFSARAARFILRQPRIDATVGPFRMASLPRAITGTVQQQPIAFRRTLWLTTLSGRRLNQDTLIRLQASEEAAVAMDRLCRILHMLNHLAVGETTDLWVEVSLRHLLAVQDGHGLFFEDVLRDCGLGADRVVLIVPLPEGLTAGEVSRFSEACSAYAARGFRLAVDADGIAHEEQLLFIQSLNPVWVRDPDEPGVSWRRMTSDSENTADAIPPERLIERAGEVLPLFVA